MDRLDEFAIFVRIVEESSLVRAASRLRRSPPAVTRALASLEARLGVRLIDRTTRRLAPTEAGRVLYDKARIVLGDYEAATLGVRERRYAACCVLPRPSSSAAATSRRS